jgi:hypothetical protein
MTAEAFNKALASYEPLSERHATILRSWREHPSNAELWLSLVRAATTHGLSARPPDTFIGVVLGCAMPAERLNDHSRQVLASFEKIKAQICQVVEDALYPLDLWRDLARFESSLRQLDRSDYDMHGPVAGGRNNLNHSRDRKLFAQHFLRYLRECCGEYLVEQVAEMLDIVFESESPTDSSLVRRWRSEISPG